MGAVVVIIGIAMMIVVHEGAHFVAAKAFNMKATEAFFGFGPTLVKVTAGETTYGVKAFPLGGYVRIIGMNPFEEISEGDEERTYRAAPFSKKAVVVLAGVASHVVVAFFLFAIVALVWGVVATDEDGEAIPTTTVGRVSQTLADGTPTPAALSGVEPGDTIVSFDGMPIPTWEAFGAAADAHPNQRVVIGVVRDGAEMELTVTLAELQRPVIVDGEPLLDDNGNPVTRRGGFFGVSPTVAIESVGPAGAMTDAGANLWFAATQSIKGLWQMIVNFPRVVMAAFGGSEEVLETARPISPIGLVQISGPVESSLLLLAYVNVFVAVLNVVPMYPLDGGHFAVALYEKIRGRAPDVRKLMPVAVAVFAFVVALGLLGIYFDIVKPLQL